MPLTVEQVERIAEHKSEQVLRKYRNRSLAGFLALVVAVGFGFYDSGQTRKNGRESSNQARTTAVLDSCRSDEGLSKSLLSILAQSRAQIEKGKTGSPLSKQEQLKNLDEAVAKIPVPNCKLRVKRATGPAPDG